MKELKSAACIGVRPFLSSKENVDESVVHSQSSAANLKDDAAACAGTHPLSLGRLINSVFMLCNHFKTFVCPWPAAACMFVTPAFDILDKSERSLLTSHLRI
jgi:hypothetical protein